jgi:hypothetical protein
MTANAAFLIGLVLGIADDPIQDFPFGQAYRNFYRAAQKGLDARLAWPGQEGEVPASRLVPALLPVAQAGLERAGVDPADAAAALEVIGRRAALRRTGAVCQRETLAALGGGPEAWARMVTRYQELAFTHRPVHTWPSPEPRT